MDIEPVKSTRIYEEIVRQVKQLIADGKLKSGDQLPPERDLAEKFMVSRTSVREALRALQSRGLVEIRAGEGAFVRDISVETLIEPLALVILPHREAVGELFEARRPARAGDRRARRSPGDARGARRDGAHPRGSGEGSVAGADGCGAGHGPARRHRQ
jgi:DNA-binding GntR family transcriptional regulator